MFVEDTRFTGSTNGGSNPHPLCPKKPGRKKIPKSNDEENSNESHMGNFSLDNVVEDVVVCILSLLSPTEISACRSVNKRLYGLCSDDRRVWLAMCDRRWGANTEVRKWGNGKILYKLLYGILDRWENLVGFWRGVGHGGIGPLVSFDWGYCCLIGSRIMPATAGSYEVRKVPFLWLGVSGEGKDLCFIDPECIPDSMVGKERRVDGGGGGNYGLRSGSVGISGLGSGSSSLDSGSVGISRLGSGSASLDSGSEGKVVGGLGQRRIRNPFENWEVEEDEVMEGLVGVNLNFVGNCHIVVEEKEDRNWVRNWQNSPIVRNSSCLDLSRRVRGLEDGGRNGCGSFPDGLQLGLYQYFASKVSLGGEERSWRKQRRKEKEKAGHGRRKWEQEHFVKVVDCFPTPARPLQGLWKGITDSMSLEFILVSYDTCGGIVCRQVGGYSQYVSGYGSVFWTADSTSFARSPLSAKEEELYNCHTHIMPVNGYQTDSNKCTAYEDVEVTQVLHINYNSDLFRHGIGVSASNNMEGRLWQYTNGKFGFAFLKSNSIVDFQHIGSNGNLLDVVG